MISAREEKSQTKTGTVIQQQGKFTSDKLIPEGSRMIKASGAGHWPGCCGGQVGSCSAGSKWKWVRKEEKEEKNWMAGQFFQHSRYFFPFFQHFSRDPSPFRVW